MAQRYVAGRGHGWVATIATPNVFARETLEGRFLPLITAALDMVLGSAVQPQIIIEA